MTSAAILDKSVAHNSTAANTRSAILISSPNLHLAFFCHFSEFNSTSTFCSIFPLPITLACKHVTWYFFWKYFKMATRTEWKRKPLSQDSNSFKGHDYRWWTFDFLFRRFQNLLIDSLKDFNHQSWIATSRSWTHEIGVTPTSRHWPGMSMIIIILWFELKWLKGHQTRRTVKINREFASGELIESPRETCQQTRNPDSVKLKTLKNKKIKKLKFERLAFNERFFF